MKFSVRGIVVLLAALAAAGLTAGLGCWQMDRAGQKQALLAEQQLRGALPPLPNADLSRPDDSPESSKAQLHRRALLEGSWLPERTVFLDNRPMSGRVGFFVVTPLQLAGRSEVILVQRGWSPRDASDRSRTQSVPTPAGLISVPGRLIAAPSKVYEFEAAPQAVIRQNLDLQAFASELARPVLPLTLLQLEDARIGGELVADGLLRAWQPPDAGLHKHYGYAFQWFLLSALILGLYVWFQAIRPRKHIKPD
jgi:surfeit locus 1 family protein